MNQANGENEIKERGVNRATRIVASMLGGITCAAGVMHGYFEILQGTSAPIMLLPVVSAFAYDTQSSEVKRGSVSDGR